MNKNITLPELENELLNFTGTENYWKHSLVPNMLFTDGVREMANVAKAYWLIDLIFSHQHKKKVRDADFQIWTLTVNDDRTAVVTCKEDTNEPIIVTQELEFTDFPVGQIKLYLIGEKEKVLLHPNEY